MSRYRTHFPSHGTGLARYAGTFDFVEVNTTVYRAVRSETFAAWAQQTPTDFRFSVKINRAVTHAARLSANAKLEQALEPMMSLGAKLAAVLIQLPPTLVFDRSRDSAFLARLRRSFDGMVAWEPRHPSWDAADVAPLLAEYAVTRVMTQIPPPGAPPGEAGTYIRLHGAPRRYYSSYSADDVRALAEWLSDATTSSLVIFDNTASSAGVRNALELRDLVR